MIKGIIFCSIQKKKERKKEKEKKRKEKKRTAVKFMHMCTHTLAF